MIPQHRLQSTLVVVLVAFGVLLPTAVGATPILLHPDALQFTYSGSISSVTDTVSPPFAVGDPIEGAFAL